MKDDQLINKKYHILQRSKILKDNDKFIYNEIANRLTSGIDGINLSLKNCLEMGYASENISKYIHSRFNEIDYYILDISKEIINSITPKKNKLIIDHDELNKNKKKFDLIISNLYLHFTNNLNFLLKNILNSLNNDGFFIASLPGQNCFNELKISMMKADIKLYNGAYRRFGEGIQTDNLNTILKFYNFKIPVIEIDTIQLRYKDFKTLLRDIRNLGNAYNFYDRKKKFENKRYFKEVENIYWNNFSNNNEMILQMEIIYVSGWKDHFSQQKPLNPGEAKISLKKILE